MVTKKREIYVGEYKYTVEPVWGYYKICKYDENETLVREFSIPYDVAEVIRELMNEPDEESE